MLYGFIVSPSVPHPKRIWLASPLPRPPRSCLVLSSRFRSFTYSSSSSFSNTSSSRSCNCSSNNTRSSFLRLPSSLNWRLRLPRRLYSLPSQLSTRRHLSPSRPPPILPPTPLWHVVPHCVTPFFPQRPWLAMTLGPSRTGRLCRLVLGPSWAIVRLSLLSPVARLRP